MKIAHTLSTPWIYVFLLVLYIVQVLSIPMGPKRDILSSYKAGPIYIERSRIKRYSAESRLPFVGWFIEPLSAIEVHARYKGKTECLISESSYEPEELVYSAHETDLFVLLLKQGPDSDTTYAVTAFAKNARDRADTLKQQIESGQREQMQHMASE